MPKSILNRGPIAQAEMKSGGFFTSNRTATRPTKALGGELLTGSAATLGIIGSYLRQPKKIVFHVVVPTFFLPKTH